MTFRECDRCHARISLNYSVARVEHKIPVTEEPTNCICWRYDLCKRCSDSITTPPVDTVPVYKPQRWCYIDSGTGAGQVRPVDSKGVVTEPWTTPPGPDSTFQFCTT